jgi:hypothetical protein
MKFFLVAVCCFLSLPLAGCPKPSTPAPAGMVRIGDSGKSLPSGTVIYNTGGRVIGTVVGVDKDHRFPNGTTGVAFAVNPPTGGRSRWYSQKLMDNFFVKE